MLVHILSPIQYTLCGCVFYDYQNIVILNPIFCTVFFYISALRSITSKRYNMLYISDHRCMLVILAYRYLLYYNCIFSKYIPHAVLLKMYILVLMNIYYISVNL